MPQRNEPVEAYYSSDYYNNPCTSIDDLYELRCTNCDGVLERGEMFYMNRRIDYRGVPKHVGWFCRFECWEEFVNDLQ